MDRFGWQKLDLRYPPSPICRCGDKLTSRVVETIGKPNLGRMYYICRMCKFFQWVEPHRGVWKPSGIPLQPPVAETAREDSGVGGEGFPTELEDNGEVNYNRVNAEREHTNIWKILFAISFTILVAKHFGFEL